MKKIFNIWDFKAILQKQVEEFKIDSSLYKEEDGVFIFNFNGLKIDIPNKELSIEGMDFKNPAKIHCELKKKFFGKSLYINDKEIKCKSSAIKSFIYTIVDEWIESNLCIWVIERKHYMIDYDDDVKNEYILKLRSILEKLNPNIIKREKFCYLVGHTMNMQDKIILDILENSKSCVATLEGNSNSKILLEDILYYFYINEFDFPESKYVKANIGISQEDLKFYDNMRKFLIKERKNQKFIKENQEENIENIQKLNNFYNEIYEKMEVEERHIMNSKLKLEFTRDGNECYFYEYEADETFNSVEYPAGIENEANVTLVCGEDSKSIDFKKLLESKRINSLEAQLSEESKAFDEYYKDEDLRENDVFIFPEKITYSDVTERLVLGYLEITKSHMQSKGIWAFQGERWFEFRMGDFCTKLKEFENIGCEYSLKLVKVGNENVNEYFVADKAIETNLEDPETDTNDLVFQFPLNTTEIGNHEQIKAELEDKGFANLEFEFSLKVILHDSDQTYTYGMPFNFKLADPASKDYKTVEVAAIDFGTSSTCIAINEDGTARKVLLSLENPELSTIGEHSHAYENPTNLLIRNWKKLYEIWKDRETKTPLVKRYERIDDNSDGVYNQGYILKEQVKDASKTELKALATQLKLVPYHILTLKDRQYLSPYQMDRDGIRMIELVADYDEQNKEKFDPISFYSYLLGRAITSPLNNKIITKFFVTVPVKFEENVKKAILKSIKSGLLLAYPENLKNSLTVSEGYEEPVAFIGAVCGRKDIREDNWDVDSKFAVFDFGGGTVDFSFGIYREADEDDDDECEYDRIIEVINTAGEERSGAEYMIHSLSYYIYELNKDQMSENRIPFVVPVGENELEGFPVDLLKGNTEYAVYNVKKINENISRLIFEDDSIEDSSIRDEINDAIELQDENGEMKLINLVYDIDELRLVLRDMIKRLVDSFDGLIKENFTDGDPYENLHIFRGGNASRSKFLEEILDEKYSEVLVPEKKSAIHFIDEDSSVEGVKPKTAVVFGELKLRSESETGVVFANRKDQNEIPFEFNVGYKDLDDDTKFVKVLGVGNTNENWTYICRAEKMSKDFKIYYTKDIQVDDINSKTVRIKRVQVSEEELENGNCVWIRPKTGNKMEYVICKSKKKAPEATVVGTEIELERF